MMKIASKVTVSFSLALILLLTTLGLVHHLNWQFQLVQAAGSRYVAKDCTGAPPPCYLTLQAAIDAATHGDIIKVAAGIYTDVNNYGGQAQIAYLDKTVIIRGGYSPAFSEPPDPATNLTTLEAEGQGRVLYVTGQINPVIEGLQLSGGDAAGLADRAGLEAEGQGRVLYVTGQVNPVIEGLRLSGGDAAGLADRAGLEAGGGVYLITATATFSYNLVFNNRADFGGGLYLNGNGVRLYNNTVISNSAVEGGGGLTLDTGLAELSHNTVVSNTAGFWGGGLYLFDSTAMLSGNIISTNTATFGGGIMAESGQASLHHNYISGNSADFGGGVSADANTAIFNSDIISANTGTLGGGLFLVYDSSGLLTNTVIANNQVTTAGAGLLMSNGSSARLLHATITGNHGGDGSGINVDNLPENPGSIALTNTIIAGHTVGITVAVANTATLESTLWHNNGLNWAGLGVINSHNNYTGNPLFTADGYHVGPNSAAIDKGIETGLAIDIDGQARTIGPPDLGVDEAEGNDETQEEKRFFLPLILRK